MRATSFILVIYMRWVTFTFTNLFIIISYIYNHKLHLLTYAFQKKLKNMQIDQRQLPTRTHEGVRLEVLKVENVKFYRSINYRAHEAWNNLEVPVTLINSKKTFKKTVQESFAHPEGKP